MSSILDVATKKSKIAENLTVINDRKQSGVNEHAWRTRSRTTLFLLIFNLSAAARCSLFSPLLTRLNRKKSVNEPSGLS